jgi:hypothetical protein
MGLREPRGQYYWSTCWERSRWLNLMSIINVDGECMEKRFMYRRYKKCLIEYCRIYIEPCVIES